MNRVIGYVRVSSENQVEKDMLHELVFWIAANLAV